MNQLIRFVDKYIFWLVWISIGCLFVEFGTGTNNSVESATPWFLLIERFTAGIFFIEYVCRFIEDRQTPNTTIDIGHSSYPLSVMGFVDLLAFLPFVVGFFLPVSMLGWVRAFRILRVLKLFRYSRDLQLFALAIYRSLWLLKAVGQAVLCFGLLAAALIYEAEHLTQPDKFDGLFSTIYFIMTAASTVGFGDIYPMTTQGRLVVMLFIYIPVIGSFASLIGVLGASFNEVMQMERDPNIDPIEEFIKERRRHVTTNGEARK
jgi:voltage-gated potassium channel